MRRCWKPAANTTTSRTRWWNRSTISSKNGMVVMGSFIIGLDGETKGAGQRICAFIEQTDIPVAMLGVLQAAPHTSLWNRLEREGRLRRDVGHDGGTFSAMNFEPDRPEAEIMQEYADAWDYLYEPSRYLARAYRYYLAMRPARRDKAMGSRGTPAPGKRPRPEYDLAPDDPGYCHNSLAARGPCVVPASVLDPVDRDGVAKPEQISAIFHGLRHGRGPVLPEKGGARKGRGHHQGARHRGCCGEILGPRRGPVNSTGRSLAPPPLLPLPSQDPL